MVGFPFVLYVCVSFNIGTIYEYKNTKNKNQISYIIQNIMSCIIEIIYVEENSKKKCWENFKYGK